MPFPESGIRVSRAGSAGALLVIRSQSSKEISGGFGAWVDLRLTVCPAAPWAAAEECQFFADGPRLASPGDKGNRRAAP